MCGLRRCQGGRLEVDHQAGALELAQNILNKREVVGFEPFCEPAVRHLDRDARSVLGEEVGRLEPGAEGVGVDFGFHLAEHQLPGVFPLPLLQLRPPET